MPEAAGFALFLAMGAIGVSILWGPIGQALGRSIGRRQDGDPKNGVTTGEMAAERIAQLEIRVQDLEVVAGRMIELEERVEFAERLLGQLPAAPTAESSSGESR